MKCPYPSNLYTIVIHFGETVPSAQLHFSDPQKAGQTLRTLTAKMNKTDGQCIESLQLWHKNTIVSSYNANPPKLTWIPPKDPETGIRHIPEHGLKGKKARRLPSTTAHAVMATDISDLDL